MLPAVSIMSRTTIVFSVLIVASPAVHADAPDLAATAGPAAEESFSIIRYLTPPSRLDVPGLVGSLTIGENVHAKDWRMTESQLGVELRYRYLLFDLALAQGDYHEVLATPNPDPYGFHRGDRIGNLVVEVGLSVAKLHDFLVIPFVGGGSNADGLGSTFGESHVGVKLRWSSLEAVWLRRNLRDHLNSEQSIYSLVGFRWHIPIGDWRLDDPLPEPTTTTVLPSLSRGRYRLGCCLL